VWTIVNRNEYNVDGRQMSVPHTGRVRYFDLYHGVELTPSREGPDDVLSFSMEGHGYGAILATKEPPDAKVSALMSDMKELTARPMSSYSAEWKTLSQQIVDIPATKLPSTLPPNMIRLDAADFVFKVEGVEIEGSDQVGVDVQYPWEDMPRRFHEHVLRTKPFAIDKYPVTNADFKRFLDATHYQPADSLHFLLDWQNGTYPTGWDNKPVTWVSQEDARAFAAWAGKRLPHEWEWQFASQGTDRRLYPWGNEWNAAAVPTYKGPTRVEGTMAFSPRAYEEHQPMRGPDAVDAHPVGASPSGVMDLVGNVWQWTDEYRDDHTRAAILRGGSYYQPQGSIWYFPQAYRNDQHGKLLLMAPSYDRSATIGFRCVVDLE
jgi:formylglycine-generating enzyme required for sulfatase activity